MIAPGTRIGSYEVTALIGAGGMGEVYRAHDTRLNRDVALKVLPEMFARDRQRMARFEREAKLLASLNHPNIAAIYGLEESGEIRALVMELVEGPTLAERIRGGAIPLDEALPIARQVADAVEYAHDKSVIHRDLKPANIKVTADGTVKVLDFGLAKAMSEDPAEGDMSNSPTLSMAATRQGVILGTAAYMSPEQAKGKVVDRRADVWAFGCVLYEMLTGKQVFHGEDVTDVLAAVVKSEPEWNRLPATTPHPISNLMRRCLEKNVKRRLVHIGEARILLEDVLSGAAPAEPVAAQGFHRLGGRALLFGAGALLAGGLVAGVAMWVLMQPEAPLPVRLTVVHPGAETLYVNDFDPDVALSPDGRRLVYIAGGAGGAMGRLYVRALDELRPTLLADSARSPFFSPDGQWVGFLGARGLAKVAVTGGPAVAISAVSGLRGAAWGPDDTIIFATIETATGLLRIPAAGGEPEVLTKPDPEKGEVDHLFPEFLPGGRAVLFTITNNESIENSQIAVLDLETRNYRVLIHGGSHARYSASGHIVYGVAGTLRAVAFDLDSLEARGTPVPVLEGTSTKSTGAASFSLSRDGTLVYLAGQASTGQRTIVWVDRQGREEAIKAPPRAYAYLRLSPDGTRIALDIRDQENDIWIWDLARETLARLTFDPGLNRGPVWTPDGKRVAFSAQREGSENIYWQAADGSGAPEPLTQMPNTPIFPHAFSPDGTLLLFTEIPTPRNISLVKLDGDRKPQPLLQSSFSESSPEISPDGRWLAYDSNESGRVEVYVRPFPDVNAGRWQISTGGGASPLWNPNGRELFYYGQVGTVMAVRVEPSTSFQAGAPQLVLQGPYVAPIGASHYSVSRDGRRFLMIKDAATQGNVPPPQINVVLNWSEELKRRVPTGTN
jgi:serine/threonine-protein kinase